MANSEGAKHHPGKVKKDLAKKRKEEGAEKPETAAKIGRTNSKTPWQDALGMMEDAQVLAGIWKEDGSDGFDIEHLVGVLAESTLKVHVLMEEQATREKERLEKEKKRAADGRKRKKETAEQVEAEMSRMKETDFERKILLKEK